jgi:peptidylprolyl isomerase
VITEVKEETVTLDANHPLAGQDLIFDIELVEMAPKSLIIMP